MFRYIKKYLGWRNWAVFTYNAFLENIFLVFFIALNTSNFSNSFFVSLLIFYLFSAFSTSYGYLINDLADIDLDALHGKQNTFKNNTKGQASFVVGIVFIISSIFAYPFINNRYFLILWGLWIFIASFYSLNPLRLKERGKWGLIVVVGAQRLLPTLLVFSAFEYYDLKIIILFSIYIFLRGLASDVAHQIEDHDLDLKTETKTFAVDTGLNKTIIIFKIILEGERFLLLLVMICLNITINKVLNYSLPFDWIIILFYLPFYIYAEYLVLNGKFRNPFLPSEKSVFQFIHHPLPSVIIPIILSSILARHNFWYLFIIAAILINIGLFRLSVLKNNFISMIIMKGILAFKKIIKQ